MNADFLRSKISGFGSEFLTPADRRYIDKFWIDFGTMSGKWLPVLQSVFIRSETRVSIIHGKEVDIRLGGILFDELEFNAFLKVAKKLGGRQFAVVEDVGQPLSALDGKDLSFFRLSFPPDISWEEMTSSCPLAEDIFKRPIRRFFVVLDNGKAGKYVDSDDPIPYEIAFTAT